jgi:hypothetical protein
MARAKRPFLRFMIVSLVLTILPIVVAPFLPLEEIKPAVETKLSALLGRQVSVGSMRLSLFGGPYLYINGMTAKEDPAFGEGNFLEANQVRADFSVLSFVLHRQIEIDSLKIQAPDLTFVKNSAGKWSWTTLGKPATSAQSAKEGHRPIALAALATLLLQNLRDTNIKKIEIEQASVRLLGQTETQTAETLYRHVGLQTSINRQGNSSQLTGQLRAQSDETNGAALFNADMPFALTVNRAEPGNLSAEGKLGPGAIESKNFAADNFQSLVDLKENAVRLSEMSMNLYEGNLRGTLQLNLDTQQFTAEGVAQNLNLDQALTSKLQMQGQITGYINAQFKLSGLLNNLQEAVPTITGEGHVSSGRLSIASVNLSEQVAHALKLNQIGDMNQGTDLSAVESDFHIDQGVVRTSHLQIQQLDGLGVATSDEGWFRIETTPTLNYTATLLLSNESTSQVKNTSPLIGAAISVLEVNNRIAVPVNIFGEVRSPQVTVDVRKLILGY